MNVKFLTFLVTLAATVGVQAFTIDFNGLVVPLRTTVDPSTPLVINVAGYGYVKFEVGLASPDVLAVDTNPSHDGGTTTQNSLEPDAGETVIVTFLGPQAIDVDFDIIDINEGESATPVSVGLSDYEYQPDAIGGNRVGVAALSLNAVPEPSSGLLVFVSVSSLMLRRRR
jgi:hypothetical protein